MNCYSINLLKAGNRDSKRNKNKKKVIKKKWKDMTEKEREELDTKRGKELDDQMENYWGKTGYIY